MDVTELEVQEDDWFLLVTDGFWQHLSDKELTQQDYIMSWSHGKEDTILKRNLVEQDNFTAVLYRRHDEDRSMD